MLFTIGQLAKQVGLTTVAIRHYEKIGLIQPEQRAANDYRLYSDNALRRLQFIQNAKQTGFTLQEIKKLLEFIKNPNLSSQKVKDFFDKKTKSLSEQIETLQYMITLMSKLNALCDGTQNTRCCPILQNLQQQQGF